MVIDERGRVWSIGSNRYHQRTKEITTASSKLYVPTLMRVTTMCRFYSASAAKAKQVCAGYRHSVILMENGRVFTCVTITCFSAVILLCRESKWIR